MNMKFCSYITIYDLFCRNLPTHSQLPSSKDFYSNIGHYLGIPNTISGAAREELNRRSISEVEFYRNKTPKYKLFPNMAHALLHTNLNIPCNEVRLPFKVFQINLGPGMVFLESGEELCSILVYLAEGATDDGYHKNLYIFYQVKNQQAEIRVDEIDVNPYYFNFYLMGKETIEDHLLDFPVEEEEVSISDMITIVKLVLGVAFLAISKDRKYIQRTRDKTRNKSNCFCGSGKRYKDCCKKNKLTMTYNVGRDIVLARRELPTLTQEGAGGISIKYGYIKSGHMRWQHYKVCFCGSDIPYKECCKKPGDWSKKLIFIEPCFVRPDLPFKEQLTPRQVRRPKDSREIKRNPEQAKACLIYENQTYCGKHYSEAEYYLTLVELMKLKEDDPSLVLREAVCWGCLRRMPSWP